MGFLADKTGWWLFPVNNIGREYYASNWINSTIVNVVAVIIRSVIWDEKKKTF